MLSPIVIYINNMPKQVKQTINHKNTEQPKKEDIVEESEVEESEVEESEVDDVEESEVEDKKKQPKLTSSELFSEIVKRFNALEETENEFIDKEKEFEKEQKEFHSIRKKTMRELTAYMKRFEKSFKSEIGKKKKPRKTENAGKGGFNKLAEVPEYLREYIGINKDELMSRPQVTKLLNQKFTEDGLMKTKADSEGKETKYIILDKSTAKKLKRKDGDEVRLRDIQTFIAQFYKEANESNSINV